MEGLEIYVGKKVKIVDDNNKIWFGTGSGWNSALDEDSEYEALLVDVIDGRTIEFKGNEIISIEKI